MGNDLKNSITYDEIYHDDLREICQEYCPAYSDDVIALIDEIKATKINNENTKIPKLVHQIYAFLYDTMMSFSLCEFIFEKVTTQNLKYTYIILI